MNGRYPGILALLSVLAACTGPVPQEPPAPTVHEPEGSAPLSYPQVDDLLQHDTLLIQTTFDLGDGTWVMVASHVEERRAGLRLYRFRTLADNSAQVLAVSSPGYDSETLYPTFFRHPLDSMAWLVLANVGERDSWGQKVFTLDERGFRDHGFLDLAMPETGQEGEERGTRLRNIAPYARCSAEGGVLQVRFVCDSVYLYDDLRGGLDRVMPAGSVRYLVPQEGRAVLWVDGEERRPSDSAASVSEAVLGPPAS